MEDVVPVIRPRSWSRGNERSRAPSTAAPSQASDILTALQRLVVGQQAGLQELSLLLAMHALGRSGSRAPNAVILGPTGVGKTHALAVASRALGLPFATTDATLLVPSGIVGEQVEDVLEALVDAAGYRDVPVGTVDKFQGQEAAVSILSFALSTSDVTMVKSSLAGLGMIIIAGCASSPTPVKITV